MKRRNCDQQSVYVFEPGPKTIYSIENISGRVYLEQGCGTGTDRSYPVKNGSGDGLLCGRIRIRIRSLHI